VVEGVEVVEVIEERPFLDHLDTLDDLFAKSRLTYSGFSDSIPRPR
jgi:hypothetical protein